MLIGKDVGPNGRQVVAVERWATGLCVVGATGVLVLLAPSYGWVVAARVLQAIGRCWKPLTI